MIGMNERCGSLRTAPRNGRDEAYCVLLCEICGTERQRNRDASSRNHLQHVGCFDYGRKSR